MSTLPKILIIIASVILILGAGAGVFLFRDKIPFLAGRAKKVTLTYWGLFESAEVMDPLIEEYQKANPQVTINYQLQSYPTFKQYKETLQARLSQGEGPDLARVHSSWIPQLENSITQMPPAVLSSAEFSQQFYPVAGSSCQLRGGIYCLPLMYDGLVLVYNKRLFSEAAISAPPTTWKEFRDIAVKLTQWEENDPKNRILQAGAALGSAKNVDHASDILGLMLSQSEVSIPTQLTSQAAKDVLTFYTNFALKDRVWDETWPTSVSAFTSGKVGMIFVPAWRVAQLEATQLGFSFGVTPVPQVPKLEGGVTDTGWANFWVETVFVKQAEANEAWKFLKFLSEKESQQQLLANDQKARGFAFPSSRKDLATETVGDSFLGTVVENAGTAVTGSFASCSGNPDYEAALLGAVGGVISGKSLETALGDAQESLTSLTGARSLGTTSEETRCALTTLGLGHAGELVAEAEPETAPEVAPESEPEPEETPSTSPAPAPVTTPEPEALRCLSLSASPKSGTIPLAISFAGRSSDSSQTKAYRFTFGDGQVKESSSSSITHSYTGAGTYTASLRLVDTQGSLSAESPLCQATIAATRPASVATAAAKPATGFVPPAVLVSLIGLFLLTLGLVF